MSSNDNVSLTDLLKDEFGDEAIPNIPLPNELPPLPNLNDLPPQVLHSGTVETLLGQNEDLFARLKVTFKTNAELERRLMINEQNELELKHINSSLLAQIQVLQEKDKAQKARHEELEGKINSLNSMLENEKQSFHSAKAQLGEKGDAFENLKTKLMQAAQHIESQEEAMRELERQLVADFEYRLNTIVSENKRTTAELVAENEKVNSELLSENQKLAADNKELKETTERLKNISEQRADAENKLIFFERRAEELESRYTKDFSDIQNQLAIYRTEAKSLSLQLHNTEANLDEKAAENVRLKEALTEAQDQFESLQTLWTEAQKRLEESRLKYDSLHKINQELSRKLKDQRTQPIVENTSAVAAPAPTQDMPEGKEEKFERLESLLAGIQAGFPKSVGMIEGNPPNSSDSNSRAL